MPRIPATPVGATRVQQTTTPQINFGPFMLTPIAREVQQLGDALKKFGEGHDKVAGARISGEILRDTILQLDTLRNNPNISVKQYRDAVLQTIDKVRGKFSRPVESLNNDEKARVIEFRERVFNSALAGELKFNIARMAEDTQKNLAEADELTTDLSTQGPFTEQPFPRPGPTEFPGEVLEEDVTVFNNVQTTMLNAAKEFMRRYSDPDVIPSLGGPEAAETALKARLKVLALERVIRFAMLRPAQAMRVAGKGELRIAKFTVDGEQVSLEFVKLTDSEGIQKVLKFAELALKGQENGRKALEAKGEREFDRKRDFIMQNLNERMGKGEDISERLREPKMISALGDKLNLFRDRNNKMQEWMIQGTGNPINALDFDEAHSTILETELSGSLESMEDALDDMMSEKIFTLAQGQRIKLRNIWREAYGRMTNADDAAFTAVLKTSADLIQGLFESAPTSSRRISEATDRLALITRSQFITEARAIPRGVKRMELVQQLFMRSMNAASTASALLKKTFSREDQKVFESLILSKIKNPNAKFTPSGFTDLRRALENDPLIDPGVRQQTLGLLELVRIQWYSDRKPAQQPVVKVVPEDTRYFDVLLDSINALIQRLNPFGGGEKPKE